MCQEGGDLGSQLGDVFLGPFLVEVRSQVSAKDLGGVSESGSQRESIHAVKRRLFALEVVGDALDGLSEIVLLGVLGVEWSSGNQMEVNVVHDLSGAMAVVLNHVEVGTSHDLQHGSRDDGECQTHCHGNVGLGASKLVLLEQSGGSLGLQASLRESRVS